MKKAIVITALALLAAMGCKRDAIYKQESVVAAGTPGEGKYIYWRERKPVSNIPGICAEIYSTSDSEKWGGELHKLGTPIDPTTNTHVQFAMFANRADAEAWGDSKCPNN